MDQNGPSLMMKMNCIMTDVVCYQDDTALLASIRKVNLDGAMLRSKLTGNDIVMILLDLKL